MTLVTVIMKAITLLVLVFPLAWADPVLVDRGMKKIRAASTDPTDSTKTLSQPAPTASIIFRSLREMETCKSGLVEWLSSGSIAVRMALKVTNIGVAQDPAPPLPESASTSTGTNALVKRATDVAFDISDFTSSSLGAYTWPTVNVSQGWYQLIAQDTQNIIVGKSGSSFFVRNGTDVSCLTVAAPPQTTSDSATPTSPLPSSPPSTRTPVGGAAQTKSLNVGAVAGGVAGGIVALAALIALAVCCRRARNQTSVAASSHNDKGGAGPGILPFGRWGRLGSGSFNDKDKEVNAKDRPSNTPGADFTNNNAGRSRSQSNASGGFLAGVLGTKSTNAPPSKKPKKVYQTSRHNSRTDSIGGIMSSSATTSITSSSAFHGTEEDFNPYPFERPVPMSPISAGGSSAASSFRITANPGNIRSPFSDPSPTDDDSIVYGLHGMSRGTTGMIPIGYDGSVPSSGASSPSPIPSYNYDSSTGAAIGHGADSEAPSRRSSSGHPDRAHNYSAFRDGRERAQTLTEMYAHTSQQTLPETPRNESILTFTSSSSANSKRSKTRSKSFHEPNSSTELQGLSSMNRPPVTSQMQASSSLQSSSTLASGTTGGTFGNPMTTKRGTRKPVPSYSPEEFANLNHGTVASSPLSSPGSSPTLASPLSTAEGVVSHGQREIYRQHELLHKNSSGSMHNTMKMHVLMPDMPPPQRG